MSSSKRPMQSAWKYAFIARGFTGQALSFALTTVKYPNKCLTASLYTALDPQHKPRKHFKGCLNVSFAACHILNSGWGKRCGRNELRRAVHEVVKSFQEYAMLGKYQRCS